MNAEDYDITEAMLLYGGSFVEALAMAFRKADVSNEIRIKAAFPEYWREYREKAAHLKRMDAEAAK